MLFSIPVLFVKSMMLYFLNNIEWNNRIYIEKYMAAYKIWSGVANVLYESLNSLLS